MEVKKSKKAILESRRGSWLLMGFVTALSFMFVSFEWTQHGIHVTAGSLVNNPLFVEELMPITYPEAKVPPPPPPVQPTEVLAIVDNTVNVTETTVATTEDLNERYVIKAPPAMIEEVVVEPEIVDLAEKMPEFPGGKKAMMNYLARNVKYPIRPQEVGIQGRVIVQFVVERDGSISNLVVVRSVDPDLDKEALRVVEAMPKWAPGMQNGKLVRVKYTLPVYFKLQ